MKKLLILLFSAMISFNSYGEWIEVTENITLENIYYVDIDTIKESGGYVYWYQMNNYTKPDKWGDMSSIFYVQGDCGVNRFKLLSGIFYQQPIGISESSRETIKNPEWNYTFPGQVNADLLDYVCDYVK
jgi:hypothetical protein